MPREKVGAAPVAGLVFWVCKCSAELNGRGSPETVGLSRFLFGGDRSGSTETGQWTLCQQRGRGEVCGGAGEERGEGKRPAAEAVPQICPEAHGRGLSGDSGMLCAEGQAGKHSACKGVGGTWGPGPGADAGCGEVFEGPGSSPKSYREADGGSEARACSDGA